MSTTALATPAAATTTTPWTTRQANASDLHTLATWHDLLGAPLPPPQAHEAVWVAVPTAADSDPETAPPRASLRLRRHIGQPVPRAWFRLGWAVHASDELALYRRQRTLLLCHDLTGADELTGFALAPGQDPAAAGGAWAALLAAAAQPEAPGGAPGCIAELPGLREPDGHSPVWDALGRHFCGADLDTLRRQHGPTGLHQLATLMPRHLLYAALLPAAAQAALGQVAPAAQALLQALQGAGFVAPGHVTTTDGGLVLAAPGHPAAWA